MQSVTHYIFFRISFPFLMQMFNKLFFLILSDKNEMKMFKYSRILYANHIEHLLCDDRHSELSLNCADSHAIEMDPLKSLFNVTYV